MNREQSKRRLKEYEELMGHREREDQLKHHGVKGMKWGVRRFQPYTDSNKRKGGKGGVFKGMKERRKANKDARKQQSVTITDKEGNKSTYTMSSEAAKKYKENAKKQGYKFEQKPLEKKSKKDKQSNKKEESKKKPYVVSEAEEKKQLEVMNKHYDAKTNTLDDEAFIKDWNENYASKFKSANAKTSTTKESGKTPKGQQKVTVTDKDGVSSTYTMDASAAAKFKKKADEQGMKWEQEPVKKKKLKQSALTDRLVNDQFLKHGIDLGEFYDRES